MANLLAYDAGGVEQRRIIADNILRVNIKSNQTDIENPIREMIANVKEDERALYKRIGVKDYKGFITKLESIRVEDLDYLLTTGQVVKHYIKNYSFPSIKDQDTAIDYLRQLIELNYNKILPDLKEMSEEPITDITDDALRYIRQVFKNSNLGSSNQQMRLRYFGKNRKKVGIAKIKFTLENKKQGNVVTPRVNAELIDVGAPISSKLLGKIITKLGTLDSIMQAFPTVDDFKRDVEAIVLMVTPANWKEDIIYAIKKCSIEITRTYAGLVGYLGELRALAILHRFFGTSIQATGGMKDVVNKQQIPIDAVIRQGLNYFGFQVKNYTLNQGKATFTGGMTTANFVANRLCLSGTVEDILTDILATYQFNQPFTGDFKEKFDDSWMTVDEYEDNIYTQVGEVVHKLHDLFESRIGNILRIGYVFSTNGADSPFGTPKMYYNSFFLIGEHYVPSSVILEGLLEQLMSEETIQKYSTIDYDITNNKDYVMQNYYAKVPAKHNALKEQKIHYNIVLDVQGLVNRALKEF